MDIVCLSVWTWSTELNEFNIIRRYDHQLVGVVDGGYQRSTIFGSIYGMDSYNVYWSNKYELARFPNCR